MRNSRKGKNDRDDGSPGSQNVSSQWGMGPVQSGMDKDIIVQAAVERMSTDGLPHYFGTRNFRF